MMMMTTLPTKATQTKLFGKETTTKTTTTTAATTTTMTTATTTTTTMTTAATTTTTAIAKKETSSDFFSFLQPGGVNASGSSFQPSPANDCCKIFSQLSVQMKCLSDRKPSCLN